MRDKITELERNSKQTCIKARIKVGTFEVSTA